MYHNVIEQHFPPYRLVQMGSIYVLAMEFGVGSAYCIVSEVWLVELTSQG